MPVGFAATDFNAGLENGVWIVVLGAPSAEEDDLYLMFQKKHGNYSRQDIKFGWDKPYVEFCGQGWSWYGHMNAVELERGMIRVTMDREAAEHMQNDGLIEVRFNLADREYSQLQSILQEIFSGVCHFNNNG
jgi:hypothetical protein